MKNKVLFIVTEDWYFRSHRFFLAKDAIKKGYDVALLSRFSNYKKEINRSGIKTFCWNIDRLSFNPIHEIRSLFQVIKTVRNYRPDLIHAVAFKPTIYSFIAGKLLGIDKFIFALGGLGTVFSVKKNINKLYKIILLPLLKLSFSGEKTRLILQNTDDIKLLLNKKIISKEKITLIRGAGVDTKQFSPSKKNSFKKPVVLFASRLLWTKGVGDFIECAARLKPKRNSKFVLVGKPDNLNPESVPEGQINEWEKNKIIDWWGYQENMARILQKSSIVCLPTVYGEGLPKILIEAASCGLPIITYNVPGCREIVKDKINGYLVPVNDIDNLEESLNYLIENKNVCEKMGRRGREYVIKYFSQEQIADQTIKLWDMVLAG